VVIRASPYPGVAIPDCSLTEYVLGEAANRGGALAAADGATGERTTYGELHRQCSGAASTLAGHGIGRGDVVALMSRNQPAFIPGFHGAVAAGGVVTTLNPLLTEREASEQIRHSRAKLLLVDDTSGDKGDRIARATGCPWIALESLFALGGHDELPKPGPGFDPATELAALPYSSGTTGVAKGVMLTHRNLVANLAQFAPMWPYRADDIVCAVVPMAHIYGMNVIMNLALASGSAIVTLPRFSVEAYLAAVERFGVTRLHLAPPMVLQLVNSDAVAAFDLSSVRWAVSGAAPLDAELAARFEQKFGVPVAQGYGMTEASPGTHLVPEHEQGRAPVGSVGWLMPNTECRLVDPASGADSEREGELWVRGPQVMAGYLEDPVATAHALGDDGWLRTGDIGRCEGNAFFIVDRLKELIKYKGHQVAPAELEALLLTHPGVADVAVVGVPDRDAGEVPKAFVVPAGDLDPQELLAWVSAQVAPYKRIRAIEVVETIPKSPSGKILRRVLRDRVQTAP
jgi:acyl-CoA synthetase (AMP-forming)/AMP-acid ligase II